MVRRLKIDRTAGRGANQIDFEDFVAADSKSSGSAGKRRPLSKAEFTRLLVLTNEMKDEKKWSEFTPKNFVGLYCLLHRHVYDVMPDEVRSTFSLAVGAATRQLKNEFNGNKLMMVQFIRWTWSREKKRNEHRSEDSDFRIGWRLQFGPTLLSDYRVFRARKGRKIQ